MGTCDVGKNSRCKSVCVSLLIRAGAKTSSCKKTASLFISFKQKETVILISADEQFTHDKHNSLVEIQLNKTSSLPSFLTAPWH